MGAIVSKGKTQFLDGTGAPLAGGFVYMYVPGTTTPKTTWQDSNLTIANSNPITLDANGECLLWGSGSYQQLVTDSLGNQIWNEVASTPLSLGDISITTYAVDTGVANAYVVNRSTLASGLTDGMLCQFRAIHANTGPSTINVDGLGALDILADKAGLQGGEIIAGGYYSLIYSTPDSAWLLIGQSEGIANVGGLRGDAAWVPTSPPTYVDATHFTLSGDWTSHFHVNRRARALVLSGTQNIYGYVSAASYATSVTTVTVVWDSGSLDNTLSDTWFAIEDSTNPSTPWFKSDGSNNPVVQQPITLEQTVTLANALNDAAEVSLASAATINIGAAASNNIYITGTTAITAFDNVAAGITRHLRFAASLTLTYNATSLILPGGQNIITAAGDTAIAHSLGGGNWQLEYFPASGAAVASRNRRQVFTSSGTFTVPDGVTTVYVTGGGGGGGGAGADPANFAGGGGGSAPIVDRYAVSVTPYQAITVTIGGGGGGGASSASNGGAGNGGSGGSTAFGGLSLPGGGGGQRGAPGSGGSPGTGSTRGYYGGNATGAATNAYGGGGAGDSGGGINNVGGAGRFGYGADGGGGVNTNFTGLAGNGHCSGGSGAVYYTSAVGAGGNGAPGFLLVEW